MDWSRKSVAGIARGSVDLTALDVVEIVGQWIGLRLGEPHSIRDVVVVTQIRAPGGAGRSRRRRAVGRRCCYVGSVSQSARRARCDRRIGRRRSANVRRNFRRALDLVPGIESEGWTPRELRHSFVSLLSDAEVSIEVISQLVGHTGTTVTETVHRKQVRPVIQTGALVMDARFEPGMGETWHAVWRAGLVFDSSGVGSEWWS